MDKKDQFFLYFIFFIRFFFYLIEIFLNYIFYFFKVNFIFLNFFFKKLFLGKIQSKKQFLVNDLYNSFSTKILISSTAFFILYLVILLCSLYLLNFNSILNSNSILISDSILTTNINPTLISKTYPLYPEKPIEFDNLIFLKKNFEIKTLEEGLSEIYLNLIPSLDIIDDILENHRVHIKELTPVLYKSDSSPRLQAYLVDKVTYYLLQTLGREIPESLFKILHQEAKLKVLNEGNFLEIEMYNIADFQNKLLSYQIYIKENIFNFFEKMNISSVEQLESLYKEEVNKRKAIDLKRELIKNYFSYPFNFRPYEFTYTINAKTSIIDFPVILNTKFILETNILITLFFLINVLHTLIAFLSLGYDYLLKKLNFENIFVLFFISSTTLQMFFKILAIYFI